MLTAVQKLGLMDFRGDRAFLREVVAKQIDEGIVQEWNLWVWAAETDSNEELIFNTDGAAQLTEAWPRRVASAGWSVFVFGISHDGAHRRLLGAACAPCMLEGQFSTSAPSAPAAERTAAAAVGLLLEEGNSGARLRRVSWIADSTYALNVAGSAPTLSWPTTRRLSRVETCHVHSHAGELGNECADMCLQNCAVEV